LPLEAAPGDDPGGNSALVRPATPASDPGLALVVERWADLPEPVRAGIVAMVEAQTRGEAEGRRRR
jgi:hypothetical protein